MKAIDINEQQLIDELMVEFEVLEQQRLEEENAPEGTPVSIEHRLARYAALNVDFIETAEELRLYTDAIYQAVLWGQRVK